MAASSSKSVSASKKYDVFISFRGEDTRHNFISHLSSALSRNSIKAYIDYEVNKGDEISTSLIEAIEDSYGSIVVFSKNYASSKLCLNELLQILECRKQGHFVIPVYYNINPSDVRRQTASYGEAFARHERDSRQKDKLQLWRTALSEAANIAGWDSQSRTNRDDYEFIQNIVNDILQKLDHIYQPSESSFVGIDKYCEEIESLLQRSSLVGICGMGGVGKTTIAKVIFHKLFPQYDSYYFFENVEEESNRKGLNYIRNKLLSELLEADFHSWTPKSEFVMRKLSQKKVLVVLDDVNSLKQLEHLQLWDCLGKDSKVIITTRHKHMLAGLTIDHEIYEVPRLDFENSCQLFRFYAFNENFPEIGYEEITEQLVSLAQGLPLTLKILGSFLCSKSMEEWKSALEKLQEFPHDDIQKVLSYDGSHLHRENSSMSMKNQVEKLLIDPTFWIFVGFVSSASGLLCFALSLSFQRLFGKWNIWKIFLYGAVSLVITGFMLLPKKKRRLSRRMWLKVYTLSLVYVLTAVGTFFYDRVISEKLDRLGLSSVGLFSLSSFSLSRQIDIGFEVGFTNFLLATSTVQIMHIHEYLVCLPAAIYFAITLVRSYLEYHVQETATGSIPHHVVDME